MKSAGSSGLPLNATFPASRFTIEQKPNLLAGQQQQWTRKGVSTPSKGKGLKERSSLGVYTCDAERKGAVLAGRPQGLQGHRAQQRQLWGQFVPCRATILQQPSPPGSDPPQREAVEEQKRDTFDHKR